LWYVKKPPGFERLNVPEKYRKKTTCLGVLRIEQLPKFILKNWRIHISFG
jgi:hypothetical protein